MKFTSDQVVAAKWKCSNCNKQNFDDESFCVDCKTGRSASSAGTTGWGSTFAKLNQGWTCEICRVNNPNMDATMCASCDSKRTIPGAENSTISSAPNSAASTANNSKTEKAAASSGKIGKDGFMFGSAPPSHVKKTVLPSNTPGNGSG
eukprot:CAMPEP_0198148674 /NCGR_PEP_ID=MMETSP1443-20131203/42662_1 /TAXON_ID=186043 /ORGANISM="Entomoneis sp., Strain CCMP2396" /LENGTH=147 /DNA_ID=CAMNT_0043813421 /DNA_START=26 /DNA_END=465 /DNA_ORIENTATION=+